MKIDYVAKSKTETNGTLIFWHLFAALYICYSCWILLQLAKEDGIVIAFFFLITFLVLCMFKIMEPDMKIVVEEAKKFLEDTGQEISNENINLLVGRYYEEYRKDWLRKIANILNVREEIPNFENLKYLEENDK